MKTGVIDFKMECGELYVCCLVGEFGHMLEDIINFIAPYGETNTIGVAPGGGKRGYVAMTSLYHGVIQKV